MQPRMPSVPTSIAAGARNLRGASGCLRRRNIIAAHTAMKAVSVPALASAAISDSGNRAAITETMRAVKMVIRVGEPRFDTCASFSGSSPSRAIARKIRLCPKKKARMTVGSVMAADSARILAAVGSPIARRMSASGSGLSANTVVASAPIAAAATAI